MSAPTGEQAFEIALTHLLRDEALAAIVAEHGRPGYWSRPPGFATLVLLILEQQVSLASAAAAFRRMLASQGGMTPRHVLGNPDLRGDGVSRQKERYLLALATAVEDGSLDLDGVARLDDDAARSALLTLPGIGRWTADVYLLVCLDRPDLWPVGDRALQVAVAETLGLEDVPRPETLERLGEGWRPYRSTAARLLWHGYLRRRGRGEMPVLEL